MKIKLLTFISLNLFFYSYLIAQKNACLTLENDLKNCKIKNEELIIQNNYYKETLNLIKPIQSVKIDDLQLDITSVIGSKIDKTITITFIYKNIETEIRNFFQCEQANFVDLQGNQSQTYEVIVSFNNGIRAENINPNIPTKATITFREIETNIPIIRELKLSIFSKDLTNRPQQAVFENLEVKWK